MVHYVLDPALSRFTVQAFAGGMLGVFAHSPTFAIRDFAGGMSLTAGTLDGAAFEMTVRADSLELLDNFRPHDRHEILGTLRDQVLEVTRYPEIRFQSGAIAGRPDGPGTYQVRLAGSLALHGAVRGVTVEGRLRLFTDGLRLDGALLLPQSAFGIRRVKAAGGMITVKDDLKFVYDLGARKQQGKAGS
jgi:polyisoprenoid-binding protein YceI